MTSKIANARDLGAEKGRCVTAVNRNEKPVCYGESVDPRMGDTRPEVLLGI